MNQDELCIIIAEKYYQPIYKYCYAKLNCDANAAQDCTQNVFLIMIQKKNRLNLSNNMQTWLYKTADRVIRNYLRKEKRYQNQIPIDEIELADQGGLPGQETETPLDCLTEAESALLHEYYEAAYGTRNELANQHNMTLYELYKEIERIKKKVKSNKD